MDLTRLTDGDLLTRRHQAFLRLSAAAAPGPARATAYEEIRLINRELERRRRADAASDGRLRRLSCG